MITRNSMNPFTSENGDSSRSAEFPADEQFGKALEAGLGAIQQVFSGFAKVARDLAGSEIMKNFQAAAWLASVADSLESVVSGTSITGTLVGELNCYQERMAEELAGSKFASIDSFRERLDAAVAILQRAMQSREPVSDGDAQAVATAAGYFRAAAKSVVAPNAR